MQGQLPVLPIGNAGALRAEPVTNVAGDHAVLVREGERTRALLAATRQDGGETLLVMPLDDEVQVRVDGDALAMYVASGSVAGAAGGRVPGWASAIGLVLLLVIVAFAVLGSLTFFGWLFGTLLGTR